MKDGIYRIKTKDNIIRFYQLLDGEWVDSGTRVIGEIDFKILEGPFIKEEPTNKPTINGLYLTEPNGAVYRWTDGYWYLANDQIKYFGRIDSFTRLIEMVDDTALYLYVDQLGRREVGYNRYLKVGETRVGPIYPKYGKVSIVSGSGYTLTPSEKGLYKVNDQYFAEWNGRNFCFLDYLPNAVIVNTFEGPYEKRTV